MSDIRRPYYKIQLETDTKYQKSGTIIPVFYNDIIIGRSDTSNIQFDDNWKGVSRNHAKLVFNNGKIMIIPLHSGDNTTLINGNKIVTEMVLKLPSIIQLSIDGPRLRILSENQSKVNFSLILNILILVSLFILIFQLLLMIF